MKKTYEAPTVERVEFKYRDQVVVASGQCIVEGNYSHFKGTCNKDDASVNYNN